MPGHRAALAGDFQNTRQMSALASGQAGGSEKEC
jgi:hypothetical protein